MTRTCRGVLLLGLACLLCACGAYAATRTVASTDHIPLGDWTYDAMVSLAADGLVPGYAARVFEGDRLFDRMQMAEVVASVIDVSERKTLRPSQMALLQHLVQEFRPELDVIPGAWDDWSNVTESNAARNGDTFLMGYVRGTAIEATDSDSDLIVPHRISLFSNLSSKSFALGTMADKEDKFFQQYRDSTKPDKLVVQGYSSNFAWSLGRQYQSWGPAYSGSLILSDNSLPFWIARGAGDVDFGKIFGRFKITEFASAFEDDETLFFFGRRYEKPVSARWNWGISETALMNKAPNPTILVLPFYLYQHIFGGPGSSTDQSMNTMYATDLTYRTRGGTEYYGELLIDDITAPRIVSDGFDRPRKIGYTLGVYLPKFLPSPRLSTLKAEYISIDRQTYEASRPEFPELAYIHNYSIIGHPIGPNARALYLRGEHYLSDKWSLIGEYFNQTQKDPGAPASPKSNVVSLMAAYDIAPDKSIALRVAPFETTLPGGQSESGTKYELRASIGF